MHRYQWEYFPGYRETFSLLLLYVSPYGFWIIPKRVHGRRRFGSLQRAVAHTRQNRHLAPDVICLSGQSAATTAATASEGTTGRRSTESARLMTPENSKSQHHTWSPTPGGSQVAPCSQGRRVRSLQQAGAASAHRICELHTRTERRLNLSVAKP